MEGFLKKILEHSEQDTLDSLTRMETPPLDTFRNPCSEYVLPVTNIGLPGHLIQCHHPRSAYVTHTSPVVQMLMEQDDRREASSCCPTEKEPNGKPQEAGFEEKSWLSNVSRDSNTSVPGKDSARMSRAESSLPSPSVCSRVIFARKPPLRVLRKLAPCHPPARSDLSAAKPKKTLLFPRVH